MPYIVNFTDRENKVPITVYDNTSNTDTSLTFPGRNVTGYGQLVAENFISLLENFSKSDPPINPIEGQLWYDSSNLLLMIWDGVQWKAAGNIQKSSVVPDIATSNVGELWVDTANQQLYVFSGTRWILVGPNFSTGLRSGPLVEQIDDSDGIARVILVFYVEDSPIFIISRDSFTPKVTIEGFARLRSGLNITSTLVDVNGFKSKLYSTAVSADSLIVNEVEIPSSRFLRSDITNTVESGFNIRSDSGINIGTNGNFTISASATSGKLYNSESGSSIDIEINRSGFPETILRVIDNKVGINVLDPDESLEVSGNIKTDGALIITNLENVSIANTGALQISGGAYISKGVLIGDSIEVQGASKVSEITPRVTERYNIGSGGLRFNNIYSKTLIADTIKGNLEGNIIGNATTATNLRSITTFAMTGDVSAPSITFDGQVGGLLKIFNTSLTADIITSKTAVDDSEENDTILLFRAGEGLLKADRDTFIADLGVPIGAILPFAGANAPSGYLLCDGSEVEIVKYQDLYDVLGNTYGTIRAGVGTFRLPDLRGRFPLGRDNMDNSITVPNALGGYLDGGGGNVDRVPGTEPDILGGTGGQSSVFLEVSNLPQHEHNMKGDAGIQYYATRLDTAAAVDSEAFTNKGPTTVGQMQYLPSSGGIKTSGRLAEEFTVMNPFLTVNYIIRSGPPAF